MLTFGLFERYGNLGNQLFQYASMLGLSKKYNTKVVLPRWKWADCFVNKPDIRTISTNNKINETHFHYNLQPFDDKAGIIEKGVVDVTGWLQSEKYWVDNKKYVLDMLAFKEDIKTRIHNKYKEALSKKTICISIRRGDYVGNPNYELLPIEYYYLALFENFPDWKDYNILIFSDDIPYCRIHFGCLNNCYFVNDLNPIDQLVLGNFCDHFIIANSTFSWWLAYLGRKETSIIVRPNYHFAGNLLKDSDYKDYYPSDWNVVFDHKGRKLDAVDATFIIPVAFDSLDRIINLGLSVSFIQHYFNTNIMVGEQDSGNNPHFKFIADNGCKYMRFDYEKFHRTKMLNVMTEAANTPIVINFDADILVPPIQMFMALEKLRTKKSDFIYPYDGQFARVNRLEWLSIMQKHMDVGMFRDTKFQGTKAFSYIKSVGGVIAYNKDKFVEAGGENEKMISYAPEDTERFYRFQMLGYNVDRIDGTVFHMDHKLGINSSTRHEDYDSNENEFSKIKAMPVDELRNYTKSWHHFLV